MFNWKTKGEKEKLEDQVRDLKAQVDDLEVNLIHDHLTGLKTRAFFEEEISVYLEIIDQQAETGQHAASQRKERFGFRNLSIIFFDIDHFKKINDEYGHDVGDMVLKKVASVIQSSLRTGDTVARWGGEEIIVSLLGADERDATAKAEEIRQMVGSLIFANMPELTITISAGVASSERGVKVIELEKRADKALYKAKQSGRNQVVMYSELSSASA
ncbi:MAG: GGDEF domain-containing protein [Candidatus Zambryskibacteria bacterium]|nr:GGDEF domain-containing protein [Candidatus Zambryskibacteria bacterium]